MGPQLQREYAGRQGWRGHGVYETFPSRLRFQQIQRPEQTNKLEHSRNRDWLHPREMCPAFQNRYNSDNKIDDCERLCNADADYIPDTSYASIQHASYGRRKHTFRDKRHRIYSLSNRQPNCRRNRSNYSNEINIIVKGISWIALRDSGACRSCFSKEFIDKCKIDIAKLEGKNVKFLTAANGQALKIEGQAEVPVTLNI